MCELKFPEYSALTFFYKDDWLITMSMNIVSAVLQSK